LNIWLLAFESIYTVKVGGLAEVPPRLGEALARKGHNVYILVPGHGFHKNMVEKLEEIFRINIDNTTYHAYLYREPPVPHIIFTGGVLDEPGVYSPGKIMPKAKTWARILGYMIDEIEDSDLEFPNIIHGNDWHSIPAMLSIKARENIFAEKIKTFYQIHLLSRSVFSIRDITIDIGIDPHVVINGSRGRRTILEYYEASRGLADRLGALISNKLLTVSRNYMKTLIKGLGWDLENHVDYIPNATTWSLKEVVEKVKELHPSLPKDTNPFNSETRRELRKYFETHALGNMPPNEPVIEDEDFKKFVERIDEEPFRPGGRVTAFDTPGPLVIMTGRLARQKGIHVLLKALDELFVSVPGVRIVLLLLPVWGERRLAEELVNAAIAYRDNLRVVFGRVPSIYFLAHISADVMAIPSIYEPFGLVALEGMLTGNTVVASRTGGLAETVKDIRVYGVEGTGLHVEPGDSSQFANALINLVLFMETGYREPWSTEWYRLVDGIDEKNMRDILYSNPRAPWLTRESAQKRALEYSWDRSADKALKIYGEA